MKYGVHKMTWGKYYNPEDPVTFLLQAKSTGAETVEFRPTDDIINRNMARIREIKACARDLDLELLFSVGMPPGLDMRSEDPLVRSGAVNYMKKLIRGVAETGGTEIGGAGVYSTWPARYDYDRITPQIKYERTQRSIECVREIAEYAGDYGIELNVEVLNRFENYLINTVEEGLAFIDQVGCPNCGLLLDVFHLGFEEDHIPDAIRKAAGRIGQFHATEPNRGIPYHNERIHWPSVGKALRDAGYDRNVTIEAAVAHDDEATYDMRMWRNLLPDVSLEARIEAMRQGLEFLKTQFSEPEHKMP